VFHIARDCAVPCFRRTPVGVSCFAGMRLSCSWRTPECVVFPWTSSTVSPGPLECVVLLTIVFQESGQEVQ
jgi:hypothetical protein